MAAKDVKFGRDARERLDHAGLGLGAGDRHVDGVGVLLAVEPPAPRPHEVVDVVDVELVAGEGEQERGVAEDPQLAAGDAGG